ncbi:MAG: hypothetical protein IJB97_04120 [Clostridia bacterium]|nr:hypothetical protein [Clostridia bacterium]
MTVREVIKEAAEIVGAEKVKAYIDSNVSGGERQTEVLLRCFNLVENELALDYLPLKCEETFQTQTGAIDYASLSKKAVRILSVKDESGNSVPFKTFPDRLKTQAGVLQVLYSYLPEEKTLSGESDFKTLASKRLFAYGVAAEYCLSCGLYEEAAVWDKKYKEAIAAVYKAHPPRRIASRRWI